MPLVSQTVNGFAWGLVVAALLIAGLVVGKEVLVPLVFATLLAFVLSPIVGRMTSWRIPRGAASGAALVLVVIVIGSGFFGFSKQLLRLTADLSTYQSNIVRKVRAVMSGDISDGALQKAAKSITSLEEGIKQELGVPAQGKPAASAPASPTAVRPASEGGSLLDKLGVVASPLAQVGLTLLLTLFLLLGSHDLRDRVVRLMGTDNITATTAALSDAAERLSKLFLTLAAINGGFGAFVAVMLWLIGVPNAVMWGVFAFMMRFIPYIGSFLAAVPPVLLAAAVDPGWSMALATLAVFAIGEPLLGHVIEPLVLGRSVGLSPLAMVLSAAFWTAVWGPIGLILAAPITMTLALVGQYVPRLEFLSVLLGDAQVLTSEEKFYHRLLAEDGYAAGEEITAAMPDGKFTDVGDGIVLPALRLAARDFRLGVLDAERVRGVEEAMTEVRAMLMDEKRDDRGNAPPANRCLIIPARGPVDAIAAGFVSEVIADCAGLGCLVVAGASGLMALASARAEYADEEPGAILISTVGGLDGRHLGILSARAEREFPKARVYVCAWTDRRTAEEAAAAGSDLTSASASLKDVVAALQVGAKAAKECPGSPSSDGGRKSGRGSIAGDVVPAHS